jgi:hypothetical protein
MSAAIRLRILNHVRGRVEAGESILQALDDVAASDHRRKVQTACDELKALTPPNQAATLALVDQIIADIKATS